MTPTRPKKDSQHTISMRTLPLLFLLLALSSCNLSLQQMGRGDAIDSIEIMRYDRVEARYLTTGDFSALQEMNTNYPMQTRALIEDLLQLGSVSDVDINRALLEYFQDSTLQAIIRTTESEYANLDGITKELKTAFRKMKKEFPKAEIPQFYAQIGGLCQSIVVDNNLVGISLDKYLGQDYPLYERFYDEQQRQTMTADYIVPDIIVFYLMSHYGMLEFARTSQHWRDVNTSIVMYVTNELLDREVYTNEYVNRVEEYVKKHPEMTLKKLLEMTDYSEI